MKKFSNKNIFDMTKKELEYEELAEELDIKFIKNIIKNTKAVKFENHQDIIVLHPCIKGKKYQITYIWKKDNKPSGDIICNSINQAAERLYNTLDTVEEYYPKEVVI